MIPEKSCLNVCWRYSRIITYLLECVADSGSQRSLSKSPRNTIQGLYTYVAGVTNQETLTTLQLLIKLILKKHTKKNNYIHIIYIKYNNNTKESKLAVRKGESKKQYNQS
jgi:hypothetical protein